MGKRQPRTQPCVNGKLTTAAGHRISTPILRRARSEPDRHGARPTLRLSRLRLTRPAPPRSHPSPDAGRSA